MGTSWLTSTIRSLLMILFLSAETRSLVIRIESDILFSPDVSKILSVTDILHSPLLPVKSLFLGLVFRLFFRIHYAVFVRRRSRSGRHRGCFFQYGWRPSNANNTLSL